MLSEEWSYLWNKFILTKCMCKVAWSISNSKNVWSLSIGGPHFPRSLFGTLFTISFFLVTLPLRWNTCKAYTDVTCPISWDNCLCNNDHLITVSVGECSDLFVMIFLRFNRILSCVAAFVIILYIISGRFVIWSHYLGLI